MMCSKYTILMCNVNGLNTQGKKENLLNELILRKVDIAVVTDSRLNENSINSLRQNEEYNCIFNVLETEEEDNRQVTSRGVIILWKKKGLITIEELYKSDDGNLLLANCKIDERQLLIAGIYGPNADTPSFYDNLEAKLEQFSHDRVVICGDFNVTLSHSLDNLNYAEES